MQFIASVIFCYVLGSITVGLLHQIHIRFPNLNLSPSSGAPTNPGAMEILNFYYSINQWNHDINFWLVSFLLIEQNFHCNGNYSLISIRQNYYFDMFSMIWHKIVCWLLKIYQDLRWFAEKCSQNCFCFDICCVEQF